MITNERQYKITRNAAARFRKAISDLAAGGPTRKGVHPRLLQAEREGMESQLADLQAEMREYEDLKSTDRPVINVDSIDELADGIIKARVVVGLSQKALAARMGLKEQQIQRYEAEHYKSASYRRLCEVSRALGLRVETTVSVHETQDM